MELEINTSGFSGCSVFILLVFLTRTIISLSQTPGLPGVVNVGSACNVWKQQELFFQLLPFLELHRQGSWVVRLAVMEAGESSH